jgi:hypothetical protein
VTLVTLLAAALLLTLAPFARAAPPRLLGGLNILGAGAGAAEADRAIASARQMHAQIVRTNVPWAEMEPMGPGKLDPEELAFTDRLTSDAAAAHIKVIMTVGDSPCWASSAPAAILRDCRPGRLGDANAYPPTAPSDYGAFVALLAQRYQSQLAAIEVWNEPDQSNEHYFAGREKAARYAAVLRAAYPAIKAAAPTVKVLGGSIVGANGAFLRALYAAGVKGFYDGLSVHYYTLTLAAVRSIHELQIANGDHAPLWLDEFGWSSCWPNRRVEQEQGCVTAQTQAANITTSFTALNQAPYVAAAVLYKLRDSPGEDFGMLRASGARKPAFTALSRVLASPASALPRVRLSLARRGRSVVASGSGPVGDFMFLEAFRGSTLRYKAVFTLDRFDRFSLRLPSVLGTSGLRVRVYQLWSGPARGAQRSI